MRLRLFTSFFVAMVLFLLFTPKSVFALDPAVIKVTGFNRSRSTEPLLGYGGGYYTNYFYLLTGSDRLGAELKNLLNYGPSGFVSCKVDLASSTDYVQAYSLVGDDGSLNFDIFFASTTDINLANEEINELAKFVMNGGILYLAADGSPLNDGIPYNSLLRELGLGDRFLDVEQVQNDNYTSGPLVSTPVVDGPFGHSGPMWHAIFRRLSDANMKSVYVDKSSGSPFLIEAKVGKGYLVLVGEPIHINFYWNKSNDIHTYFKNLFALGCDKSWQDNSVVLSVPSFKQGLPAYDGVDPYWENLIYDHGDKIEMFCNRNDNSATIAECGCALTSAAMVSKYHGINKMPGGVYDFDPFYLNLFANETFTDIGTTTKGFSNGDFNWHYIGNLSSLASDSNDGRKVELESRENFSVSRIKDLINEGKPVIAQVIGRWGIHWVVVKGYDPDTDRLIINDPAVADPVFGEYSYLDQNYTPVSSRSMIVYKETKSDFRHLQFAAKSDVRLLVTDSEGNKTGFDPETNTTYEEIPNSSYILELSYGDATSTESIPPSTDGVYFLTIKYPKDGEYKLKISNDSGSLGEVDVYSSDVAGGLAGTTIMPQESEENYTVLYNAQTAGEEITAIKDEDTHTIEITIDVDPFNGSRTNIVIPHKWFPVPVAIFSSATHKVDNINKSSILFGKQGTENSLIDCLKVKIDVNRDNYKDLICYFAADKLGVGIADTQLIMNGKFSSGEAFTAKDSVKVLKPWLLFH